MAAIVKRGKKYALVYKYEDENGVKKQKWETFETEKAAKKRKAEIEYQSDQGTFIAPNKQTVSEFLEDFVALYGEKKWGVSMYSASCGLIENYINPTIGDLPIQSITTRTVDKYIMTLKKTDAVSTKTRKATTEKLTDATIEKIIKLLRCAFNQAVRWELIGKNPFLNAILPTTRYKKRDIWDIEMIQKALDACKESRLYISMNLSFACSMRLGEILGLPWYNVHISDEEIAADNAYVIVDRELERASWKAIQSLDKKDIYHIFESTKEDAKTRVIIKKPKTESSIRKIWLPKTLAYMLRELQDSQTKLKDFLGDEYKDYGLVVAQENGHPCDGRVIEKLFKQLKEDAGLPNVVFHSLRHSSTTYKLKLNHGDLKATQGDTGHAEIDMITRVYAHILDEDRKVNAQKFESAFYANPDLREVRAPQEQQPKLDLQNLLLQLQQSPELADTLANLLAQRAKTA